MFKLLFEELNEEKIISKKQFLLLGLSISILTMLLNFLIGYYLGSWHGYLIAEDQYRQNLFIRDYNITSLCVMNVSTNLKLGSYNEDGLRFLATGTVPTPEWNCTKNLTSGSNIA